MPRRSRPSGRPSTTSRRTSSAAAGAGSVGGGRRGDAGLRELAQLIERLPPERAATAFTHASWAGERTQSYERLEFLGDSVLELAVAHTLYELNPGFSEGELAKARAHIVSRVSCAIVARELNLGAYLVAQAPASVPENVEALAVNRNVLAALLEAVLGALFLEHGFAAIEGAIVAAFSERIDYALHEHVEYKTELQEAAVRLGRSVAYAIVSAEGPAHDRFFRCAALVDGEQLGSGSGRSKKAAEQEAAREALEALRAQTQTA